MAEGGTTAAAGRWEVEVDRGIRRMADPRCWGAAVGAVGASVFVHANRGQLPAAASVGAVALWLAALAAFLWAVYLRPRRFPPPRPLSRRAGWVYLASVAAMIAGIRAGRWGLVALDEADAVPAVIVLAVGLHFLPFARAFRTPMFTRLGIVMATLGGIGIVLGIVWTATVAAVVAVATGLVMLLVIAEDALRDEPDQR